MAAESSRTGNDTRQQILKESEKLYHTGGYEKISLQAIAETLQVSKPALFHHFKNKQILFFEMLKSMLERMNQMLNSTIEQSGQTTRSKLLALMQRMTLEARFDVNRLLREDYQMLDMVQQQTINGLWYQKVLSVIARVFEEGIERKELKPHNTTLAAYMFMNTWELLPNPDNPVSNYVKGGKNSTLAEFIETLLDMFLNGLAA